MRDVPKLHQAKVKGEVEIYNLLDQITWFNTEYIISPNTLLLSQFTFSILYYSIIIKSID